MRTESATAALCFLALCALHLCCARPEPIAPVCTAICPETPIVMVRCGGVRVITPGWRVEDFESEVEHDNANDW